MAKKKEKDQAPESIAPHAYKATMNVIVGSGSERVSLLKGDMIPTELVTEDLIAEGFAEKVE